MSTTLQAVPVSRPVQVGDVPRGIAAAALTMLVEVALGVCLVCLFLLALAWDPIDRKIGARGKRIAERTKRLQLPPTEGAYAILPPE